MGTLSFIDAAYPPLPAPHSDGVCGYIGGDALNIWSGTDWASQPARYRLPVFVRADPPGPGAAADVAAAVAMLLAIGAPRGTLVAWDMEEAEDPAYIREVWELLSAAGWKLIVYGAQSTVFGNDVPNGMYFGAQWTGTAHIYPGDVMTQWVSFSGYDEDLALSSLPFWDTHPTPPVHPEPPALPAAFYAGDDMSGLLLPKSAGPTPVAIPAGTESITFTTVDGGAGTFATADIQVNWHGSKQPVSVEVNPDGTWPRVPVPANQGGCSVWRIDKGKNNVSFAFNPAPPASAGAAPAVTAVTEQAAA